MVSDLAFLPDDVDALCAMVVAQAVELAAKDGLIGSLRLQLARLRCQQFGRSSERLERDIAQLELALEELEGRTGRHDTGSTRRRLQGPGRRRSGQARAPTLAGAPAARGGRASGSDLLSGLRWHSAATGRGHD